MRLTVRDRGLGRGGGRSSLPASPALQAGRRRSCCWSSRIPLAAPRRHRFGDRAVAARHGLRRSRSHRPGGRRGDGRGAARGALRRVRAAAAARPRASRPSSRSSQRSERLLPADPAIVNPDPGFTQVAGRRPDPVPVVPAPRGFPQAWDLSRGTGVIVGVIDSGIDDAHPELQGKIVAVRDQDATSPDTLRPGRPRHPRRRARLRGDQQPERDRRRPDSTARS